MNYKTFLMIIAGIALVITAVYAIDNNQKNEIPKSADIVMIDSMKVFGELERPGVTFPHDRHTKALEAQGKDCNTCHQTVENRLVYKYGRVADQDKDTTLEIYHNGCISCHKETAEIKQKTGPVECGECHQQEPTMVASRAMISFDQSLHYRHIAAADDKCETCHHVYDEASNQLVYKKGAEAACQTCHKGLPGEKAGSYQSAAHEACISCHQEELAKGNNQKLTIASAECASCHDATKISQIVKLDKVPRLNAGQPDITYVKSFDNLSQGMMDAVVFNHKAHEEKDLNCSTCHHEGSGSCEDCHTLQGAKTGNWVTLAQAMHKIDSDRSCIGCHTAEQKVAECAGCHSLIKTETHISDTQQPCKSCHTVPIEHIAAQKKAGAIKPASQVQVKKSTIDWATVPDEFEINVISGQYKGAYFPHRAIVEKLMVNIKDNDLASYFHQGEVSVCQGCHHNSQDQIDPPPRCISCHSPTLTAENDLVPPIKEAYHRQCFECHEQMEIKNPVSTDCVACHQEK